MLQNAYLLAKIGADTAENEQHFAEILPIGRRVTGRVGSAQRYAKSIASFQVGGLGVRAAGQRRRREVPRCERSTVRGKSPNHFVVESSLRLTIDLGENV